MPEEEEEFILPTIAASAAFYFLFCFHFCFPYHFLFYFLFPFLFISFPFSFFTPFFNFLSLKQQSYAFIVPKLFLITSAVVCLLEKFGQKHRGFRWCSIEIPSRDSLPWDEEHKAKTFVFFSISSLQLFVNYCSIIFTSLV